jgi:RNA polymerase sigma factor (sigma-70 family)
MSSAQVGAVLRHIRQLASAPKDREGADRELLERFATDRDGAAFAGLLRRHGPMVLRVCRGVLRDLHGAEDVFQATFLVLAQKAGSIHRGEAVSSWLYQVAYHLATRAKTSAARRKVLETRAVAVPSADPVLDMSLRELRAVLLEELHALPEQYRAPLVLCGLEEKPLDEAARLLGWTKGAVKGRLQRGRVVLRARLRRRGLELPAVLFATAFGLGSASARVPAALADSTLRAALKVAAGGVLVAGLVSAEVAALVEGASQAISYGKAKFVTALLLAATVAVAAFGVARHQAAAADPPAAQEGQAEKKAQPKAEAEATVEVRGRVLDPDGKPRAGAKLYLAQSDPAAPAAAEQAASGTDGRFRFAVAKSALEKSPQVMAVATGYGCDWLPVGAAGEELSLCLVKDVPISGRILDPDGKPLAGAKLTVTGVSVPEGDGLGGYVEAVRKGGDYVFSKDWEGPLPGRPAVLTTGADGRFKFAGAGRERVVHFYLEAPAIASVELDVMTRAAEKVAARRRQLFGASFDYVAVASRPIRGVVRDKDTRKPLAGMSVSAWTNPRCQSLTDKEGRYELLGLAKASGYGLAVKPADGLYFQRQAFVEDTPGLGAVTGDIEMVCGLTVRGKVTDKEGKPVAQARVEYYPLFPNASINAKVPGRWVPRAVAVASPDGSYALTVLPGPGVIGVSGPRPEMFMPALVTLKERKDFFKGTLPDPPDEMLLLQDGGGNLKGGLSQDNFNALVLLNPGEKEPALVKDVTLDPGNVVTGRVVGPDGRPVAGVTAFGLVHRFAKETLKGAEFTVRLNPRVKGRPLVFYHKEKNLGFFVQGLGGDAAGPLTVKLQPCGSASGRVVDEDGQPVAGLRVHVSGVVGVSNLDKTPVVVTDKEGRFRAEGLVPGLTYYVMRAGRLTTLGTVSVEPGKNKDMGDVTIKLDK